MKRAWIALALAVLVVSAAAVAARHPRDPRQVFSVADQTWANRIVVKRSDLPAGWRGSPRTLGDAPRCSTFDPDLSDLVVTGQADSLEFVRGTAVIASETQIFRTARANETAFRRSAKREVIRCYDEIFRKGLGPNVTLRLVSGQVVAAPRVGERRFAVRVVWELTAATTVRMHLEAFGWDRGRASTAIAYTTIGSQPDRALAHRVAQRLDARMHERR